MKYPARGRSRTGKWKRVSVQPACNWIAISQVGKEIMDLREAYKKKMGDKYKLKEFNEKFLLRQRPGEVYPGSHAGKGTRE